MDNETYELLISKFDSLPALKAENLAISFFDISLGDYENLLDESIDSKRNFEINKEGIIINLKKTTYIESIRLIPPANEDLKSVELSFNDLSSKRRIISKKESGQSGFIEFEINDFIQQFRINDNSWLKFFDAKPAIIRITVKGITNNHMADLSAQIRKSIDFQNDFQKKILIEQETLRKTQEQVNQDRQKLEEQMKNESSQRESILQQHQSKVTEIQNTISSLQKSFADEESKLKLKSNEVAQVQSQIDSKNVEYSKMQENIKTILEKEKESNLKNKELLEENRTLEGRANGLKNELLKLSNDKSLFTEDIRGHFREGYKQIRLYVGIAMIPILVSIAMALSIFLSADKITNLYIENPQLGIISLLASRMPYTTISLAIIALFAKIISIFVKRTIEIHEKRLRFSEIGILTKDASDSMFAGTQGSEKARQQLRLGMRMKLIREYISGAYDFEAKDTDLMEPLDPEKANKSNT